MNLYECGEPLSIARVYEALEGAGRAAGILGKVPGLGDVIVYPGLKSIWKSLDLTMQSRHVVADYSPKPISERFLLNVASEVGWTSAKFCLDDDIGALLWCYNDFLAGVQVLLDLEEELRLPPNTLDWETWERTKLGAFLELLERRAFTVPPMAT